eukprot:jgi/Tetstr1/422659/TSEL_001286.t1
MERPTGAFRSRADEERAGLHTRASRRAMWHLLPVWALVVLTTKVDRGNISFVAGELMARLEMSNAQFGQAAGLFFLTYMAFQLPSLWVARRMGMRRWTTALLLSWAAITSVTAFVTSTLQLSMLRLALGAAEAGTFAMMYAHLDSYLLQADFSLAWAIVAPGTSAVSSLVAGPLAAAFLASTPPFGLQPWQWLLVGEGLLAASIGAVVWATMLESPETDTCFSDEERRALLEAKAREGRAKGEPPAAKGAPPLGSEAPWAFLAAWKPWYLCALAFLHAVPVNAFLLFLPLIIRKLLSSTEAAAAALNALPCAIDASLALGYGQLLKALPREARLGLGLVPLAIGVVLVPALASTVANGTGSMWSLVALSLMQGAMHTPMLNIDTLPTAFCREFANISDIYALINMARSAASYAGTVAFGALTDHYGSSVAALCVLLPASFIPTAALFAGWFYLNGVGQRAARMLCFCRASPKAAAPEQEDGIPLVGTPASMATATGSPHAKREHDEL